MVTVLSDLYIVFIFSNYTTNSTSVSNKEPNYMLCVFDAFLLLQDVKGVDDHKHCHIIELNDYNLCECAYSFMSKLFHFSFLQSACLCVYAYL